MGSLTDSYLRIETSGLLIDLSASLRKLASICRDTQPGVDSEAFARIHGPLNVPWWRGSFGIQNIHEDISILVLAGVDHARSFAKLIRTQEDASASLATMARGSIEALARAHWLLTASTGREAQIRCSLLGYFDLGDLEQMRPKGSLERAAAGTTTSPAVIRDDIRSFLASVGAPKPKDRIGQSTLASDLVQATLSSYSGMEPNSGKQVYSDLSGIAHGHFYALNVFLTYDGNETRADRRVTLAARDDLISDYSAVVSETLILIGDSLIGYFEPATNTTARWITVRDRARQRRVASHIGE